MHSWHSKTIQMKKLYFIFSLICTMQIAIAQNAEKGKQLYKTYCLACHMADGGGVPNLNPPLAGSTNVVKNATKTIQTILKGMNSREAIDDEYYSNNMASFSYLKDQEIADIVTYIRTNFGNKATAITAAQVKKERGKK
jgi:mono/diheme cytochrome c family protein